MGVSKLKTELQWLLKQQSIVPQHFGVVVREAVGQRVVEKGRQSACATCQHGTGTHAVPNYFYIYMDLHNSLRLDQLSTAIACHAAVVCTMRGWQFRPVSGRCERLLGLFRCEYQAMSSWLRGMHMSDLFSWN